MRRTAAGLIVLMFPLLLGTTYIVKEGEKEVGKWTEDDGKDVIKYINNVASKAADLSVAPKEERVPPAEEEEEDLMLEKAKREDFGIQKGITREKLEKIARDEGMRRTNSYNTRPGDWFFVYELRTAKFKHTFVVEMNMQMEVANVTHIVEESYKITSRRSEEAEGRQEEEDLMLEKAKREDFGIQKGITREKLEKIARDEGMRRTNSYSTQPGNWFFEYELRTGKFKHFFIVEMGMEWKVVNVTHIVEKK